MSITIYPEEGEVLNRPPQPSVFDCGNPLTVAEKICDVDKDSVKSVNGIEPDSNGNVEIETGGGGEGTVTSVNDVLPDSNGNVELTADDVGAATTDDIPNKLPNPQSLSLQAGKDTVLYDGSQAQSLTITAEQIGAATKAQGKKADTSVQSVNGVKPDASGNVEVGAGAGTVKSVNDVQPDGEGNVEVYAQKIGTTDGSNVQSKINEVELALDSTVKTVNGVGPDEDGNVNVGGAATVTVDVGDTVTGEPGSEASVTNSGTQQNVVLNFTIPRGATGAQGPKGDAGADGAPGEQGPKGDPGPAGADGEPGPAGADGKAATIQIGRAIASAPGSDPQVMNTGTENAAVLNFILPRGEQGPQGPAGADGQDGEQGPKGDPGPAGADGEPGAAATITVGSTTTGAAGTQASVTNSGTKYAAVLNFTIPRGEQGPGLEPMVGNTSNITPTQVMAALAQGRAISITANGTTLNAGTIVNDRVILFALSSLGILGVYSVVGDPESNLWETNSMPLPTSLKPGLAVLANNPSTTYLDGAVCNFASTCQVGDILSILLRRENSTYTTNTVLIDSSSASRKLVCYPNNNGGATIFSDCTITYNNITFGSWYSGYEYTGNLSQNLVTGCTVRRYRPILTY